MKTKINVAKTEKSEKISDIEMIDQKAEIGLVAKNRNINTMKAEIGIIDQTKKGKDN